MKNQVIEFLQNRNQLTLEEQFNKAYELYRKSPGKSFSVERMLNVTGFTKQSLETLIYDIKNLNGVRDAEAVPVPKKVEGKKEGAEGTGVGEGSGEGAGAGEGTGTGAGDQGGGSIETDSSTALKLREEFPFLNDEDCPDDLKILVADKYAAYHRWDKAHSQLAKIEAGEVEATEEEITELSKIAVENFEENQALYEELNYYKEHGEIKGAHNMFETLQVKRKVAAMTNEQLAKEVKNAASYISKQNKALEEEEDPEKIATLEKRIADRQFLLNLVNARLAKNE